ncbi:MAG: hypothetical protein SGJ13_00395 [Actinomycetota bacterium]|nr:hypothetical protein [Actinomycetota bacterium]
MFSRKKLITAIGAAALLVASLGSPASADLVVTGGSLNFDGTAPTVGNFAPITLNGTRQQSTLTIIPFTVEDSTGSAAGWHVLLTVPDLINPAGATHTIAASTITMQVPVVAAIGTSSLTGVTGAATAGALATGEKIVVATATNGMGMYSVSTQPLKVTVPVTALAGTYASVGTIATVSGP